jgi:hypothetical protein
MNKSPILSAFVLVYRAMWPWQRWTLLALVLLVLVGTIIKRACPGDLNRPTPYSELSTRRVR